MIDDSPIKQRNKPQTTKAINEFNALSRLRIFKNNAGQKYDGLNSRD